MALRDVKPTVLVVDDESIVAETVAAILNQNGFQATVAHDGASAMEMARQCAPDIVLTDVVMPDGSGVDLGVMISRMAPACRIVLFSGRISSGELLEHVRACGYSFEVLAKPLPAEELLAAMRARRPVARAAAAGFLRQASG